VHLIVEDAYADLEPPTFYRDLFDVYARGRFPCGWEGAFPAGRVLVW
jgi:hypothetical protein